MAGRTHKEVSGILESGRESLSASEDGCRVANAAFEDARKYQGWWERALFGVGLAVLGMIVALVFQLTDLDTSTDKVIAAASAGATVATGVLGAWVVARQQAAAKEVRDWASLVERRCKSVVR